MKARLRKVRENLRQENISNLLISSPKNITYITGISTSRFHRESFLYVSQGESVLFHSTFLQVDSLPGHIDSKSLSKDKTISSYINKISPKEIWIESNDFRVSEFNQLKSKINSDINLTQGIVEKLRIVKDDQEIKYITRACEITKKTWLQIKPQIIPGKSEKEIQTLIITILLKNGADQIPPDFLPIVASGKNSSHPHHKPSDKKIDNKDVIMVDFGCTVNGYHSDMTRTICLGENPEFTKVEEIIMEAYQVGVVALNLGSSQKVDQEVKKIINNSSYKNKMVHSTGHGLGLSIHEKPSLSTHVDEGVVEDGMVVTIEPGIYIPNEFGYRYENTILISENRAVPLT